MSVFDRRKFIGSGLAASALASLGAPLRAFAQGSEIVIGAAPPISGVFAFAGAGLNAALADWVEWKNASGGIAGRKLRYLAEDWATRWTRRSRSSRRSGRVKRPVFYGD